MKAQEDRRASAGRRVIVLGGAGVFRSRLAELLIRDGHTVRIAGRNGKMAAETARRLGATSLVLDRTGHLGALADADALVDCAGPFQDYGDDPYRLARACLTAGIDYLDLSDASGFTTGIAALDPAARSAGRSALSGVSSVPALSSAAVCALAEGLDEIAMIETAILPGNRAPRGRSVVASILSQVGRPLRLWRGGEWEQTTGWSEPRRYELAPGLARKGYVIGVPDLEIFPEAFGARSVVFRAGLELGLFNRGLALLAFWRRRTGMAQGRWTTAAARAGAGLLARAGTDRGGMAVSVTGRSGNRWVRRQWRLVAEAGEGPFVPAVAARALLRRSTPAPPGARACLGEVTLVEAEAAMADLAVSTVREDTPARPLFERVLGRDWQALGPHQQRLHRIYDVERFAGIARVDRGSGRIARLIGALFGFPAAAEAVPVRVSKRTTQTGEVWERDFGGRRFRSHLSPARAGRVIERFGAFAFELALRVEGGRLYLPVARGWALGLPMPRLLLPVSEASEQEQDGRFHFDVEIHAPLRLGPIVRYRGWLEPDPTPPSP